MEPIILELEREQNDLLIIAHESVLRVLYGYLMACNAADIPKLEFPRDEIIEVFSGPERYTPFSLKGPRLSPLATIMWQNAFIYPISLTESSRAAPKDSRFRCHQVAT
jgi:broad specificity phosphatase PhoE